MRKGFVSTLFDFSFSEFITIRIVRFLYTLSIIFAVIVGLGMIVSAFMADSGMMAILAVLASPIAVMLAIVLARVYLELVIVVFRIAENTTRMVELKQPSNTAQ